jgi:phage terminase Nu1 subunit (DNA packaging protein)
MTTKKKTVKTAKNSPKKGSKRNRSLRDFCELTGFSARYIQKFLKQGIPHSKRKNPKGGKPIPHFNDAEALEWMSAKGIITPNAKGQAVEEMARSMQAQIEKEKTVDTQESQPEPQQSQKTEKPRLDQTLLNQMGLLGALERLKLQEFNCSRLVLTKLKAGANRDEISSVERLHAKTVIALRHAEFAALEFRKRHRELIEFSPIVKEWERLAIGIKNSVLGIASAAMPGLRRYLKEPDEDAAAIANIINAAARITLTSLPNETPIGTQSTIQESSDSESAA